MWVAFVQCMQYMYDIRSRTDQVSNTLDVYILYTMATTEKQYELKTKDNLMFTQWRVRICQVDGTHILMEV